MTIVQTPTQIANTLKALQASIGGSQAVNSQLQAQINGSSVLANKLTTDLIEAYVAMVQSQQPPLIQLVCLQSGYYGGTPADAILKGIADNGGILTNTVIVGSNQACLINDAQATVQTTDTLIDCVLLPHPKGTLWLRREYRKKIKNVRVRFLFAGNPMNPGKIEGHTEYINADEYIAQDCERIAGYANGLQIAMRPEKPEAGGPCMLIDIKGDKFTDLHHPMPNGGNSDRASAIYAIYDYDENAIVSIETTGSQENWAQVGPIVSCVPAGTDGMPPQWEPDQWTKAKVTLHVSGTIMRPQASELFRIAGAREVSIQGELRLIGPGNVPRLLIDQQQNGAPLYACKAAQSINVDVSVKDENGVGLACAIEYMGKVVGYTGTKLAIAVKE